MIKATELTEKSWLLSEDSKKMGLLRKTVDGYAIIGGPHHGKSGTHENIEELFGQRLKFVKPKKKNEEKETIFVEGYPIKHEISFLVESQENLHTYTKKEGSADLYIAGYFCIEFRGKWHGSFCPRVKTLDENDWMGPYKTKLEMDHTIRMENNK